MPAVLKYVPPTDSERGSFTGELLRERTARHNNYKQAVEYYLGEHDPRLVYDALVDPVDDNVIINMVRLTADRTTSFLFSEMPVFQTDASSVGDTEEEKWLAKFFDYNGGLPALTKLGLRGFLSGHSFIQVREPRPNTKYPRMNVLDPLAVTVYWDAEDVSTVVWYEVRSLVGQTVHIYDYVHNLETDGWTTYHYASLNQPSNPQKVIVDTIVQSAYSDYKGAIDRLTFGQGAFKLVEITIQPPSISTPPIIEIEHLPNPIDRYGMGEFTLKDLQDTINLVASLRNQIARESGKPVDVITGAGIQDVERTDDMMVISDGNATVQRLQLKGDITSVNTMLEKLIETYLSIARVVLLKGEAKDLQRVTNASVRTLFLDQIAKNNVLMSSYGRGLEQVATMALRLSDLPTRNTDFDVKAVFASALPIDKNEIANINAIMVNMGARSLRTASTQIGDNWEFEVEAMKAEQEVAMEHQRQQMMLMQEFTPDPSEEKEKTNSDTTKPSDNKAFGKKE